MRFNIDEFADSDLVCLKHQVADAHGCRGKVENGYCNGCHAQVPGILAYSFKILAEDEDDRRIIHGIQVSNKGGRSLFNMAADKFKLQQSYDEQKADEKEQVTGVPIIAKMIVSYNVDEEDFLVCAFACNPLINVHE